EDPSSHRAYLVVDAPAVSRTIGIAFRRTLGASDAAPAMCQWCHTVRGGGGVSLMTVAVDTTRTIGIYLCSDLQCEQGISDTPGINDLRESLSRTDRMQRLLT